jgi:hypothetical protein
MECLTWAEKAAFGGNERDGFYALGWCYSCGIGMSADLEKGRDAYLVAAQLGHVLSMDFYGRLLDKNDMQRYVWLGKAGCKGLAVNFLIEMEAQVEHFSFGGENASHVFAIGRALKGHIDERNRQIFGDNSFFNRRILSANRALQFYKAQLRGAREAVDTWTHCLKKTWHCKGCEAVDCKLSLGFER